MATPIGIEFIGSAAGLLTTVSFVPQVLKVLRERETAAISLRMYAAFTLGVALWFAYGLAIGSFSVIVANLVTLFLAGAVLFMKLHIDYGLLNAGFDATRKKPYD